jgi:hypothetical protein
VTHADGTTVTVRSFGGVYAHLQEGTIIRFDYSAIRRYPDGTVDTFMYKQGDSPTGSNDVQVAATRRDPMTHILHVLNDRLP